MRSDAILAGPGSTGLVQFSPVVISKQTLADLIAVGIYGLAFTLTIVLWAVWQNRGKKTTDEVEKSNYGRPLVKA
jgi:multisubunit Na+/H+ antiporter MnhC subunit